MLSQLLHRNLTLCVDSSLGSWNWKANRKGVVRTQAVDNVACMGTTAQVVHFKEMWKYFDRLLWYSSPECRHLASASKVIAFLSSVVLYMSLCLEDGTIRIWDVTLGSTVRTLSGHTMSVTCVKWGGEGLLYSSSQDRTVKVWRPSDVITTIVERRRKHLFSSRGFFVEH